MVEAERKYSYNIKTFARSLPPAPMQYCISNPSVVAASSLLRLLTLLLFLLSLELSEGPRRHDRRGYWVVLEDQTVLGYSHITARRVSE